MTSTGKQQPGDKAIVSRIGDRQMQIERVFNASRARVWDANTQPDLVAQWWGRGNKLTVEKFEAVRGGHWRFVEHTDHGDHGFEGRFREVREPEPTLDDLRMGRSTRSCHRANDQLYCTRRQSNKDCVHVELPYNRRSRRHGIIGNGRWYDESYDALDRLLASTQ